MPGLAIIGGTGLSSLESLEITRREVVGTAWGEPSGPVVHGLLGGKEVTFLPRHGSGHTIPPHRVNYRANVAALREIGIERIVAVAAVGGIHPDYVAGSLAVPDQIIDYTWGRGHTFYEDFGASGGVEVGHVDFTEPYSRDLRALLVRAAREAGVEIHDGGTYGATQGPRLESAAEIDRLERDGCHVAGMTGMPEAALAREAGIEYAHCTVIVNPAAGRGLEEITMDSMRAHLESGMERVRQVLEAAARLM